MFRKVTSTLIIVLMLSASGSGLFEFDRCNRNCDNVKASSDTVMGKVCHCSKEACDCPVLVPLVVMPVTTAEGAVDLISQTAIKDVKMILLSTIRGRQFDNETPHEPPIVFSLPLLI